MDEIEEKEAEDKLNKSYYTCFHSPEGQIVLKDLLNNYYKRTLVGDNRSNEILLKVGMREVIIYILARMESVSKQAED